MSFYFRWCKCSSWSAASFHAEDFYGWSGRTSETRVQHLPSTQFHPPGCSNCFCVCCVSVCVCVCMRALVSLGPAAKAEHDHIALSPSFSRLFSPDEGWSMRPRCVENTFSKEKIWFWNSHKTHPAPPLLLRAFKCRKKNPNQEKKAGKAVFHKVLKNPTSSPQPSLMSHRVKSLIKHFRLMSWKKIPWNRGEHFCPFKSL